MSDNPNENFAVEVDQKANFYLPITYQDESGSPVDVTGYTADMQFRQTVDASDILMEASTTNGYITIGTTDGAITINIPAAVTGALETVLSGVYDLFITDPSGFVTRLLAGTWELEKAVTR